MVKKEPEAAHERPNYYAILPANIRYAEDLSYLEKILYAEISALSNKEGHCFATNGYFAKHYKNSIRTISRAIKRLEDKHYIFTFYETAGGVTRRKIFINKSDAQRQFPVPPQTRTDQEKLAIERAVDEVFGKEADGQKCLGGDSQKCLPNSIKENSINNTITTPPAKQGSGLTISPWLGKNSHARLGRLYELLFEHHMGVPHRVNLTGRIGAVLKELLSRYSEVKVALMMILHFEWRGMNGQDNKGLLELKNAGFPIFWLPSRAALYDAYITTTMGITDDAQGLVTVKQALETITSPE